MEKKIEKSINISEINKKTIAEKNGSKWTPANMHLWWGRSPINSTIEALKASMVSDGNDEFTLPDDAPIVVDPFSGYGTIPLAAKDLGFSVYAGDLNPVAAIITKAITDIPGKFKSKQAINSDKYNDKTANGFAVDVEYYGNLLREKAFKKLKKYYPDCAEGIPSAWLWARTIKCSNPACSMNVPIVNSFVINEKKGHESWVEPVIKKESIEFEFRNGVCPKDKKTNKFKDHGTIFTCPACGEILSEDYVRRLGKEHKIFSKLMAMVVDTDSEKLFKGPDEKQEKAAKVKCPEDIPKGAIPLNSKWFSPPVYGYTEFTDLFSARQLKTMVTFCDLLSEIQGIIYKDAVTKGYDEDAVTLNDGGKGALAYSQAICVYLSFVIDKLADRCTTQCTWRSSLAIPRSTFSRQAIAMAWNYAEINPFSNGAGNYNMLLKSVTESLKKLSCSGNAEVYQGDALKTEYPEKMMVCTELPYYKNVGYAHLSDFYYIWMRRCLKDIFPDMFEQIVTSKEELSTVGEYYGQDRDAVEKKYEDDMNVLMKRLYCKATNQYPSLLFYEYHKADDYSIKSYDVQNGKATPWEIMLYNLLDSGFGISAIWPMRSEEISKKSDAIRVLIVVRKNKKQKLTTRRMFVNVLKRDLPDLLDDIFKYEIVAEDRFISAMGAGMKIFSRYDKILNADGSNMSVHDVLQIIWQECEAYFRECFDDIEDNEIAEEDYKNE